MEFYKPYINGEWVEGGGKSIPSENPYDQKMWAEVATSSQQDVSDAASAAATTFEETWRRTSGIKRAELMFRLADIIDREAERLAQVETTDNGKVISETRGQMSSSARLFRYYGGYADKISGETKPLDSDTLFDYTIRAPFGAVALITAWNSPIALLARKLAPALAAGNTAVIKPSEYTSASTLEFMKFIEEAGFPAGVVNVVTGAGDVGGALIHAAGIRAVSFTGGVETGKRVAHLAADALIPSILELGGKSANIVFDDADIDAALAGSVAGVFGAAGQSCVAGSRLLVHSAIYDRFVEGMAARAQSLRLGDPRSTETQMGPLCHARHFQSVLSDIDAAVADGATVIAGGGQAREGGLFMAPTILGSVDNSMRIAQKEIFGPVVAAIRFDTEDEAITIANDTTFGLAGGVWTRDLRRAHRIARELDCGTVWVNTFRQTAVQAPNGGTKASGYGREHGIEGLHDFMTVKNVMMNVG